MSHSWCNDERGVKLPSLVNTELVVPSEEGSPNITPKPPVTQPPTKCDQSPTLVNGKSACHGQLIFEENFVTLDPAKWEHDIRIAGSPVRWKLTVRFKAGVCTCVTRNCKPVF
jgi:hypothetical protein